MSEATTRSSTPRSRGSGRGGRGGFAGRGGRRTNGDKAENLGAFDDEGDIGELRKQYGDKTSVIREMFPDWSEVDVLFALQETNGDENDAVTRIAEGTISQWGEVSKAKKTPRPKGKDANAPSTTNNDSAGARPTRGGRIASEGGRGRGRATDRGGRGGRARASQPPANGTRSKESQPLSVPTEESSAWTDTKPKPDAVVAKAPDTETPPLPDTSKAAAPAGKTWASMLRQSTVPKPAPVPKQTAAVPQPAENIDTAPVAESFEPVTQPEPATVIPEQEITPIAKPAVPVVQEPVATLPPPKDELTETNLEQVIDESKPPATHTAASTTADSWDPRQSPTSANATPLSAAHQQHQQAQRSAASGYAATAIKATAERATRTPSYQRRVLDQEEAVRMPGNREVDRAAVQFGAFSLNDGDEDVDGEREEPETRAQPPADSPVAHPRASLPPVAQPVAVPDAFSKKVTAAGPPGMAPAGTNPAGTSAPAHIANIVLGPGAQHPAQPPAPSAQQSYGRFGQAGPPDASAAVPKPLDAFNQQPTPVSQPPLDSFPTQTSQPQLQQAGAAFSSAPNDYSNYYTANQHERNPYNFYGQPFGQPHAGHGQHEGGLPPQQRPFAGYNATQADNLSQYPQSGSAQNQPRFGAAGDSQNSGHSTPNPTAQAQQQQAQQQGQPAQAAAQQAAGTQPQSHAQQYSGYNHPYYSNPYYHQYYSGYSQGGFGPYGKAGMYGQPYGVSPNAPYDHGSSPGSFGPSTLHRDNSGLGSGLGEYGRTGSAQAGNQPGLGSNSFGSVHDSFARGASSFQSPGQSFGSQAQPAVSAAGEDLKPFGDAKTASGPSPSLGGGPRPGSATNNVPGAQSGLPPQQNSQMGGGYSGYPSHLQGHGVHGSGGYGMGAGAGASQHGNSPYGSYGQGFGNSGYYGGQQQQRGGWGGNYH